MEDILPNDISFEDFCDEVAKREGLTDQVEIGNIRETLSVAFGLMKPRTDLANRMLINRSTK